jgi:hypothetical protein
MFSREDFQKTPSPAIKVDLPSSRQVAIARLTHQRFVLMNRLMDAEGSEEDARQPLLMAAASLCDEEGHYLFNAENAEDLQAVSAALTLDDLMHLSEIISQENGMTVQQAEDIQGNSEAITNDSPGSQSPTD